MITVDCSLLSPWSIVLNRTDHEVSLCLWKLGPGTHPPCIFFWVQSFTTYQASGFWCRWNSQPASLIAPSPVSGMNLRNTLWATGSCLSLFLSFRSTLHASQRFLIKVIRLLPSCLAKSVSCYVLYCDFREFFHLIILHFCLPSFSSSQYNIWLSFCNIILILYLKKYQPYNTSDYLAASRGFLAFYEDSTKYLSSRTDLAAVRT